MDFYSIDVETANADMASICSIGVSGFLDGNVACKESILVDPNDYFDEINIGIHGITEQTVVGAPSIVDVMPGLRERLNGHIVVCHTQFDKSSFYRASVKYNIPNLDVTWLDSSKVVRRTWPEFSKRGYGLANMTEHLGISLKHHEALEDAIACGKVLLSAIDKSGTTLTDWLTLSTKSMYDIRLSDAQQG